MIYFICIVGGFYFGFALASALSASYARTDFKKRLKDKIIVSAEDLEHHDQMIRQITLADAKVRLDKSFQIYQKEGEDPSFWEAFAVINELEEEAEEHGREGSSD